jgi:hypothetical protein
MPSINNVVTSAGYTPAATLTCLPSGSLTVQVNNAGIYYQLLLSLGIAQETSALHGASTAYYNRPGDSLNAGTQVTTDERFLGPGFWHFDQKDFGEALCVGVQMRSSSPANPATVSASV